MDLDFSKCQTQLAWPLFVSSLCISHSFVWYRWMCDVCGFNESPIGFGGLRGNNPEKSYGMKSNSWFQTPSAWFQREWQQYPQISPTYNDHLEVMAATFWRNSSAGRWKKKTSPLMLTAADSTGILIHQKIVLSYLGPRGLGQRQPRHDTSGWTWITALPNCLATFCLQKNWKVFTWFQMLLTGDTQKSP